MLFIISEEKGCVKSTNQTKYDCTVCKDTGEMKYKEIEELMYDWDPWKTKPCTFCVNN
jgi:hypothetical protein